ncbi:MAG: YrdB family protein [Caldilineaceae bacterium]
MEGIKFLNLLLRFVLELCDLASLGYWGFQTEQPLLTKIGLSIGSPLLFAMFWGVFLAPASPWRLHEPWLLGAELAIFGLAIVALYSTGQRAWALAFGVLYILNKILLIIWQQ